MPDVFRPYVKDASPELARRIGSRRIPVLRWQSSHFRHAVTASRRKLLIRGLRMIRFRDAVTEIRHALRYDDAALWHAFRSIFAAVATPFLNFPGYYLAGNAVGIEVGFFR